MDERPWVIKVDSLSKYYGKVCAIRDMSFEVPQGSVTGFVGPNGAGKSTTMRCILGLTKPSKGSASVFGTDYSKLQNPARRIGSVLDASKQHPGRTGRSILLAAADVLGIASSKIEFALESCGLTSAESRQRIGTYSLGMRQRLALALAILPEPELLILDEPMNGLDPEGIHWMRSFLRDFTQAGGTVFLSSHLLGEMEKIADSVVLVGKGQIIGSVSISDLKRAGKGLEEYYFEQTASVSRGSVVNNG